MDILFSQSGFAFTWRKKTDQIIQERTDAGTDDHIALVQRAMVEVHGPIAAEQFTGMWAPVPFLLTSH